MANFAPGINYNFSARILNDIYTGTSVQGAFTEYCFCHLASFLKKSGVTQEIWGSESGDDKQDKSQTTRTVLKAPYLIMMSMRCWIN